jgi:hypothetical protein
MQANYKIADRFKQKVSLTNVELIAKKINKENVFALIEIR